MKHRLFLIGILIFLGQFAPMGLVRAESKLEITEDLIARFFRAHKTEDQETQKVADQVAALDQKIADWRDCAKKYQEAAEVSGSKLGGLAAKLALKAKCGATSDDGFVKDRQKLLDGPHKDGLSAGGFKEDEYNSLTDRLLAYLGGGGTFSAAEKAVLDAHKADLAAALASKLKGMAPAGEAGGGAPSGAAMGGALPTSWQGDAAWGYIGYLFATMYMSGATSLEKPYQPGEWTRWQLTDSGQPDTRTTIERAFLGKTPDGNEWWRNKSIVTQGAVTDTVTLEALFKPMNPDGTMKQLVRMRGKLPGDREPHEMMVPQYMSMLTSGGILPMKPTPESLEGATVGTETVAGVSAKHVKYAGGANGATIEWWLSDAKPGGWVKFAGTGENKGSEKPSTWTMEMTDSGSGAKSELGVM